MYRITTTTVQWHDAIVWARHSIHLISRPFNEEKKCSTVVKQCSFLKSFLSYLTFNLIICCQHLHWSNFQTKLGYDQQHFNPFSSRIIIVSLSLSLSLCVYFVVLFGAAQPSLNSTCNLQAALQSLRKTNFSLPFLKRGNCCCCCCCRCRCWMTNVSAGANYNCESS